MLNVSKMACKPDLVSSFLVWSRHLLVPTNLLVRLPDDEFLFRYTLPPGAKPEDVNSNLSSDGVLVVTAKKHNPAIQVKINQKWSGPSRSRSTRTDQEPVGEEHIKQSLSNLTKYAANVILIFL